MTLVLRGKKCADNQKNLTLGSKKAGGNFPLRMFAKMSKQN